MADLTKLNALSIDELRAELDARKARTKNRLAVPPGESLDEFANATIISVLRKKQKVIYGTDDRVDVLVGDANLDADVVVALFRANDVVDNGNGTSTLTTQNFGTAYGLCVGEPFRAQPVGAFCSGFLVAADVIATAGHCVNANNVTNVRFVFAFRMQNATTAQLVINNSEIYRGVHVIGRVANGSDWALVRIDRRVTNHRIAPLRFSGRIPDGQVVHVIGHPNGLPLKLAGGAAVRDNQSAAFFVANLDTYGGNSGSPVFNSTTHEVEGVLVRGENDFVQQDTCLVSLVCPNTGCRGEDCTRTTEFSNTRISLWKVDDQGNQVNFKEHGPFAGWTPLNYADGRILWRHVDGRISLWKVDDQGNQVSFKEHGPFAEWTPLNYADGRILWRHLGGRISLWKVDDQGNQVSFKEYGPFAGWSPLNCANNNILWLHADGRISFWVVDDQGNQVSFKEYGPFAGWTPLNCGDGGILWRGF